MHWEVHMNRLIFLFSIIFLILLGYGFINSYSKDLTDAKTTINENKLEITRLEKQITFLEKQLHAYENTPQFLEFKADNHLSNGDLNDALKYYSKILELFPNSISAKRASKYCYKLDKTLSGSNENSQTPSQIKTDQKSSLSLRTRQKIYLEEAMAERKDAKIASRKFPRMQPATDWAKYIDELDERSQSQIMKKYNISYDTLVGIVIEGQSNRWPPHDK